MLKGFLIGSADLPGTTVGINHDLLFALAETDFPNSFPEKPKVSSSELRLVLWMANERCLQTRLGAGLNQATPNKEK
jgi:hypothetical protein